ncbi:MAG: PEP/pyruvate-binding domain-containing protein [Bacillota bacterium]
MQLVIRLEEIKPRHIGICGTKATNLGAIARRSQTSPGFCLTTAAYFRSLKVQGIQAEINKLLDFMADKDLKELEQVSLQIQDLINNIQLPQETEDALYSAYQQLLNGRKNVKVAVRSSATAEDLPTASFAGQLESYLNVDSWEGVKGAVIACWASLWAPRGIHYRNQKGLDQHRIGMAVIVQEMVPAQVSGVMFTANPISNSRKEIYIEAVQGLGDKLVQGEVAGESYLINKENLGILARTTLGSYPLLTDFSLRQLAHEGRKLEALFADYQDVEWAFLNEELYVLQSRSITTLEEEELKAPSSLSMTPIQKEIFINIQERFPEPMLPLDTVIAKIYYLSLFAAYRDLGFTVPLTDWRKVEQGFFPDHFLPPRIKISWRRIFHLGKMLAGDLIKEWKDNETAFNRYVDLMKQDILKTFPMEIVLEYLEDGLKDFQRANTFRYLLYVQYGTVYKLLKKILKLFYGGEGLAIFEDIVIGQPQATVRLNQDLEQIVHLIREQEEVRKAFEGCKNQQELYGIIADLSQENSVKRAFEAFLLEHGHREVSQGLSGIGAATWQDQPEIPLGMIKALLTVAADTENTVNLINKRRLAAEENLAKLTAGGWGRILPLHRLFAFLIGYSRRYTAFREDSHYYLTQVMFVFRTLFLTIGQQLVKRKYLRNQAEIMYLTYWEVQALVEDIYSLKQISQKQIAVKVENRIQQFAERTSKWKEREGEIAHDLEKERILRGVGASRGVAKGICRLIANPGELHRLRPGDILVAQATNPSWTPVFSSINALIVEYGGALSHSAIIAREYGIPAVMGVPGVTKLLKDGEKVTVDGTKGLVYLE